MNKHFNPAISEEKFAAWLDGMLPAEEMQEVGDIIVQDDSMQHLYNTSSAIDASSRIISNSDLMQLEDIYIDKFELPDIENVNLSLFLTDSFSDNENLLIKSGTGIVEQENQDIKQPLNNNKIMETFKQTIGDVEPFPHSTPIDVMQIHNDTCAIKSQQIILTAFGYNISEDQLVQEAMSLNIYTPGGGTLPQDVGALLNLHGISTHTVQDAHVYDLVNELAQGHKVIVGVDSGELWDPSLLEKIQDIFGDGADHALVVTGIDTTDPNNVQIIITDPGTGDVAMRYPLEQFLDAWQDSHCIMIATDYPAPAQFDPSLINFDYDAGHIPFIGDVPFDFFSNTMLPAIDHYFDTNHLFGDAENPEGLFEHVFNAFSSYDPAVGIFDLF